jgi:hypothetical protein
MPRWEKNADGTFKIGKRISQGSKSAHKRKLSKANQIREDFKNGKPAPQKNRKKPAKKALSLPSSLNEPSEAFTLLSQIVLVCSGNLKS